MIGRLTKLAFITLGPQDPLTRVPTLDYPCTQKHKRTWPFFVCAPPIPNHYNVQLWRRWSQTRSTCSGSPYSDCSRASCCRSGLPCSSTFGVHAHPFFHPSTNIFC